jgi:hypothetical protein
MPGLPKITKLGFEVPQLPAWLLLPTTNQNKHFDFLIIIIIIFYYPKCWAYSPVSYPSSTCDW